MSVTSTIILVTIIITGVLAFAWMIRKTWRGDRPAINTGPFAEPQYENDFFLKERKPAVGDPVEEYVSHGYIRVPRSKVPVYEAPTIPESATIVSKPISIQESIDLQQVAYLSMLAASTDVRSSAEDLPPYTPPAPTHKWDSQLTARESGDFSGGSSGGGGAGSSWSDSQPSTSSQSTCSSTSSFTCSSSSDSGSSCSSSSD